MDPSVGRTGSLRLWNDYDTKMPSKLVQDYRETYFVVAKTEATQKFHQYQRDINAMQALKANSLVEEDREKKMLSTMVFLLRCMLADRVGTKIWRRNL